MKKKLVIIDGSSLLYRAFFALPPTMTSPDGTPTNAIYGFLRMLLGLYRDLDPEYMAVTFDKDRHTFRTDMFADYKATRKPAPPELIPQFDLILDVLSVLGVAVYSIPGYEGDDILGTLSARYEKELPVDIVTGDRDALQLSSSRTTVLLTQKGITHMAVMTPEAVYEKYHITPSQVIDMKALMGDTADNIPGVPGIGEKTALGLLTEYKDLDNLYAHVDEIKGARGKKLTAHKDMAYLSYKLATIKRDVPMDASLEDMKQPVHVAEMKELFGKLGINLLKEFAALPRFQELSQVKKEESEEILPPVEIWNPAVSFKGKTAALWAHLSGKAPFFKAEEVVAAADGHAWLVEADHFGPAAKALKEAEAVVVEDSKSLLESDFPAEDLPFFDMSLAAYLLDPTRVTYPLSYMAGLFEKPVIYPDDLDDMKEKGCCITLFLASLYEDAKKKLEENGVLSLFRKVEQPLVPVLAAMEKAGIATDQEKWKAVKEEMEKEERLLMKDIFTEAGESFNLNSPKQLGHILFEKWVCLQGKDENRLFHCRRCAGGAGSVLSYGEEYSPLPQSGQTGFHLSGGPAAADSSGNRTHSHLLQPDRHRHRPAFQLGSESAEHSGTHGGRKENPLPLRAGKRL